MDWTRRSAVRHLLVLRRGGRRRRSRCRCRPALPDGAAELGCRLSSPRRNARPTGGWIVRWSRFLPTGGDSAGQGVGVPERPTSGHRWLRGSSCPLGVAIGAGRRIRRADRIWTCDPSTPSHIRGICGGSWMCRISGSAARSVRDRSSPSAAVRSALLYRLLKFFPRSGASCDAGSALGGAPNGRRPQQPQRAVGRSHHTGGDKVQGCRPSSRSAGHVRARRGDRVRPRPRPPDRRAPPPLSRSVPGRSPLPAAGSSHVACPG